MGIKLIDCIDYDLHQPNRKSHDPKIEKMASEIKKMAAGLRINIVIPDVTKNQFDMESR